MPAHGSSASNATAPRPTRSASHVDEALGVADVGGRAGPVPRRRRPGTGQQEPEPGLFPRRTGRELVGRADLEDGHVGPPLAFVLGQHTHEAGQERASQLAVIGRDGVGDADGGRIVARPSEPGMVIGTDEGMGHDLRQAAPGEQVAHPIHAPPRVRPVRRASPWPAAGRRSSRSRGRARPLPPGRPRSPGRAGEPGWSPRAPPRHPRHRASRRGRPRPARVARPSPARSPPRRGRGARPAPAPGASTPSSRLTRAGRNGMRRSGGSWGSESMTPARDAPAGPGGDELGRPVGADRGPGRWAWPFSNRRLASLRSA